MNIQATNQAPETIVRSHPSDSARFGWVLGAVVLAISLLFLPPSSDALNAFDPPKRLSWALFALILSLLPKSLRSRGGHGMLQVFALVVWMVARTLLRPNPAVEIEVLFTWLLPPLLFLAAQGLATNRPALRALGGSLLAAGYLQAALMLLQRVGLDPLFAATTETMAYSPGRMVGTIGYHNQAVDFLALCAVGAIWATPSTLIRLAWIAPLFATALLTGNRGGVLAFGAVALTLLAFHAFRSKRWCGAEGGAGFRKAGAWTAAALAAAALGVAALGLSSPVLWNRFTGTGEGGWRSPAIQSRVFMGRIAGAMIRERPVFGWGAGEYAFQYLDRLGRLLPERKTHEILQSVVYAREAHNDPLQFTAEFGAVGDVLLLAALTALFTGLRKDAADVDRLATTACVLVVMTTSGFFSFPWQTSMAGPLAGLLLGLATTPSQFRTPAPRTAGAVQIVRLLIAVAVFAGFRRMSLLDETIAEAFADPESHQENLDETIPKRAYRHQALLGALEAKRGLIDVAIERLERAETGYRDVMLWNNLGHVLSKAGRWPEAANVYDRWAATGIEHPDALANLSVACENAGGFPAAAEALDAKLRLWPQAAPEEVKRLAVLFMRASDYARADRAIWRYHRRWKDADAKTVAEMNNLAGGIARLAGDATRAESLFLAALQADPGLESARKNLDALRLTGSRRGEDRESVRQGP
jgi:Tfp pilus assembly protein PilF